ncbi:Photosystem I assembly protein Ycf3 [Ferriphaselus amnicola]|uniref:Photosystem I assembly protein Ycf3 n=1 Tax=Ferriphaselus amnicola TaxID=1188319 RepID=A0A2Z6GAH2_9PROT|nr:CHAT domain-containing protein [Ferriphaselus amnicola]BBE50463.1 Photosystem I assembly protein Ycf3 [Ferriphaselus amnicola]
MIVDRWVLTVLCALMIGVVQAGDLSKADEEELQRAKQLNAQVLELYQKGDYQGAATLAEQTLEIREKILGPQHAATATSLNNLAAAYKALKQYDKALPLYLRALEIREKVLGFEHTATAQSLSNLAVLYEATGQDEKSLPLRQRILAIREKTLGAEHGETAASLNNLATLYEKLGQRDQAMPLYQRAAAIKAKASGAESVETAQQLNIQALTYRIQEQYDKALPLLLRALPIYEKTLGAEHPETVGCLDDLAGLYVKLVEYEKALPYYQRALAIREKTLGPEHSELAETLNALAKLHEEMGQYSGAAPYYQRALAIREKTLGREHADTLLSMNDLAGLHYKFGQYDQALQLYQRVLSVREKTLGPNHSQTAVSLEGLGLVYADLSQYDKALPLYQRALQIREKAFGLEHPTVASSLNNLASLYRSLGQYEKALPLYQQALAIDENALGKEHPDTATDLNNLAALFDDLGQYDKEIPLLLRALAIREKSLGAEHPSTATSLGNLAGLYETLEQYDKALALYQRALSIREKSLGAEHADTAISLSNLAMVYRRLGQFDQSLPLLQRALSIREKVFGQEHEDTANSLSFLAFLHGIQRQPVESLAYFRRGEHAIGLVIERAFSILTEQEKLALVQGNVWSYHGMLSLIHRQLASDPAAIRAGLDLVLSRKGIVFDAQARQQDAIARSLDPETKKLWDALSNQRSELAKLMQSKPETLGSEAYQKRIADYQAAITQLESQLASKSALVAQEFKQRTVTSQEVANTLGKSGVLAEFVKIQDYDWEHGKWSDTWRYLAFILHGDGKIQLVDLGEAGALESTVQAALKPIGLVGSSNDQQQDATRSLYQTLWQPIAAAVGDANKVVFSPDGLLNLVPFAAMQDDNGHYLIESRQISYVTSGRDLTKGDLGIKPETELYLAANPKFDLAVQVSPTPASEELTRGAVRSAGFGLHFSPLPGTAQEAEQVPSYLTGKHTVLTGKEATEDSVLNIRRPRVMHLSTHGFFLADQASITQGTRGASRIDSEQPQTHHSDSASALPAGYENPLVRSGLAFAGANHAGDAKGGRDGLLTALEVSGMDLHGTDLVTLSACETGRGEVKSGEGVFGLRRAFALAGTAHLMMSLWPVSDDVTAQQMQRFYQLYGKKTNPAAALRQAQLATIAELRSKKGQAEPALWAPFIVQGW